jgi:hypothetical protein
MVGAGVTNINGCFIVIILIKVSVPQRERNIDEALSYLEKAIELDKNYLEKVKSDPNFDSIRENIRFCKLISSEIS